MIVREVMSKDVKVINKGKSIKEAATMMKDADCGSIPVESGDRLVGMITDRDIAIRAVTLGMNSMTESVEGIMTEGIKYCFDYQKLDEVGEMMSHNRLRRLPVLNSDKRLVGILSLGDLARYNYDESLVFSTMSSICQ